jgi:hypothetical protein
VELMQDWFAVENLDVERLLFEWSKLASDHARFNLLACLTGTRAHWSSR